MWLKFDGILALIYMQMHAKNDISQLSHFGPNELNFKSFTFKIKVKMTLKITVLCSGPLTIWLTFDGLMSFNDMQKNAQNNISKLHK